MTSTPSIPAGEALAVCPGSFDPLTLGHVDVVERAAGLFTRVVLGVAHNADKAGRHLLSLEQRLDTARAALAHLPGVEVDVVPGLLADYCRRRGATAIVRGLRNGTDLDAELPMALLNRDRRPRPRPPLLLPGQGRGPPRGGRQRPGAGPRPARPGGGPGHVSPTPSRRTRPRQPTPTRTPT